METNIHKNTATFIHLSALLQYIIPFGNIIFPFIIWQSEKEKSELVDFNGKQILNFQLSIILYSIILALIAIPIGVITFFRIFKIHDLQNHNFTMNANICQELSGITLIGILAILLFMGLKILEFILILLASVKTSNGIEYKYPLTIAFIK